MISLIAIILGIIGISSGKIVFKRWFNHVSVFSAIWGFAISLFELRLIAYYQMEIETWMILFGTWILFALGSLTIPLARYASGNGDASTIRRELEQPKRNELKSLEIMLWTLNIISFVAAVQTWMVLIDLFGSVSNVLLRGAFLYYMRVSGDIKGTYPYFKFLCLPATMFAGIYAAKTGKIRLVSIVPIVISIIVDLASMGRAMMIMAAILFANGYFLTAKSKIKDASISIRGLLKKTMIFVFSILLLFAGSELVRSTRHVNERLVGAQTALKKLEGSSFITPSIYLYLTGNFVVLNKYLKSDEKEKFFAANTFAPFFRVLAKIGFDTDVEAYQKFFKIPVTANTGTYLRELHSDFGYFGMLIGPYIIGLITSLSWFRYKRTERYFDLVVLAYLQVLVAMSLFYLVTIAGYLLVFLIVGCVVSLVLDLSFKQNQF